MTVKSLSLVSPQEFFSNSIEDFLRKANLFNPLVLDYLTSLMVKYVAAESLLVKKEDKNTFPAFGELLLESMHLDKVEQREALIKIGDGTLYVSGLFPGFFSRKIVDVDYYVKIGQSAYLILASMHKNKSLYQDLSYNFPQYVQALSVVDQATVLNPLRLYELWQLTENPRYYHQLLDLGIKPVIIKKDLN